MDDTSTLTDILRRYSTSRVSQSTPPATSSTSLTWSSCLFGNWTFDVEDDFTTPDGNVKNWNFNTDDTNLNWKQVHEGFALKCNYLIIVQVETYFNSEKQGWCMTRGQRRWGNPCFTMRTDGLQISFTEQIFNRSLTFCLKFLKMCKLLML
jgi:hypothetical protein